ncbi:MAG: sulfate transporter CysZ [Gammaproteobacteria bacterium]|nr:MAG: sulfate transporter CysZ [Gammaproteobacteria bacterium]
MIAQPVNGASYLFRGLKMALQPKIRRFVFIPLMINVLLFSVGIWYSFSLFGELIDGMLTYLPDWLGWLSWLLWPIYAVTVFVLVFYLFSLIANVIAAPFNGILSEAVQQQLTGEKSAAALDMKEMLKQAVPMILEELKKLLYFIGWAIPFLLLLFVPLIGPLLWALFSAWMMTIEYTDYSASNNRVTFKQLRLQVRQRKMMSLGFGGMVMLGNLIPLVNFLVMPVAVCGGTIMWLEKFKE